MLLIKSLLLIVESIYWDYSDFLFGHYPGLKPQMNSHDLHKMLNKRVKPGLYGISGYLNHSGCLKFEYIFTQLEKQYSRKK